MLTLQWSSFNHAQLECADAISAFFQSDGKEMQDEDVYASALDEMVCAMNITLGSAVKQARTWECTTELVAFG